MGRGNRAWSRRVLAALLASMLLLGTIPTEVRAEPVTEVRPVSFVLDQGLPLELTFDDVFGADGIPTDVQLLGLANGMQHSGDPQEMELLEGWAIPAGDGYQGDIKISPQARGAEVFLRYAPVDFLSGRDVVHILLQIPEQEEPLVKTLTFLPGNVVYYEEDLPAIEMTGAEYKTNGEAGMTQSPDQSLPHGYDPAYATSEDVSMSGGSFAMVPIVPPPNGQVYHSEPLVRFAFTGTGFEVVSMTDPLSAMELVVEILRSEDGRQELVERYPVIFSDSDRVGDAGSGVVIYQVPLIRVSDMDYGTYSVQISGMPLLAGRDGDGRAIYGPTTYIYVDGIRIFGALEDATAEEYGSEFGAVFSEPRELVLDGKAAVLGLEKDSFGRTGLVGLTGSGITFREDAGRGWIQGSLGIGMKCAEPDNELYLGGTTGGDAMVLYVAEEQTGDGMLQVGLRDMHEELYRGLHGAENRSSSFHWLLADGSWSEKVQVGRCGTEQYHQIDYRACPTVEHDGVTYHQVLIRVPSGMLSLTGIKSVGLRFGDLFADREQTRYRYDGYGLYQAERVSQDGTEISQSGGVWKDAPQDPGCCYRTEDGVLSYAWRYDAQGQALPESDLVWISDGVIPGYLYRLDDEGLLRAARFDAYGNELRAEELVWSRVESRITDSLFRSGGALIAAAEAEQEQQAPEVPETPEEPRSGSWWQRFLAWVKELLRVMFSGL